MKNLLFILIVCCSLNGFGQMDDLIVKTDGGRLECEITFVNEKNIFYNHKKGKNRVENKFISLDLVDHYIRNNEKVLANDIVSEVEPVVTPPKISPFTTIISDSMGYQTYYAFEVYKNNKLIGHFREGSSIRYTLKRKLEDGYWLVHEHPDSIIVVTWDRSSKLSICLNDIQRIAFRELGNHTADKIALSILTLMYTNTVRTGVAVMMPNPDKSGFKLSKPYLLSKGHWTPRIGKRKETDNEKEKREKYLRKFEQ